MHALSPAATAPSDIPVAQALFPGWGLCLELVANTQSLNPSIPEGDAAAAGSQSGAGAPSGHRWHFGPVGRGVGAPALSEGEGGMFGEHLGRDLGSWNLAADEGQVPGVPLSPSEAGGLQQSPAGLAIPCFLLVPTVALKVSSVLEGSMLFVALNQGLSRQSQG